MESGSDHSDDASGVALGLVVDAETHNVTLQLLTVGDARAEVDAYDDTAEPDAVSTHSDELERILTEELPLTDPQNASTERLSSWSGAFEGGDATALELLTACASPPLPEGKRRVQEALEQFEQDRLRHCTLMERLSEVLIQIRQEKRQLLTLLSTAPPVRLELRLKQQEQLLGRLMCGKRVLEALKRMKEDERPLGNLSGQHGADLRRRQSPELTRKAFPDWLTENVPPVVLQGSNGADAENEELPALKEMAVKIDSCPMDSSGRRAYRISWVAVEKAEQAERPVEQIATQLPQTEQGPAEPVQASEHVVQQEKSDAEERDAVDVLLDLASMGLGSQPQIPKEAAPPEQPVRVSPESKPVEAPVEVPPSQPAVPEPKAETHRVLAKPAEPSPQITSTVPVQPPVPLPFQMASLAQTQPVPASLIAGGAAFGEPSAPRSSFSISSVAPQLGSLGQPSSGGFSQGGFAGITGGFSAFAKQAASQSGPPVAMGQQSQPPAFGGTPLSGIGTGSATSGLFGAKPITKNEKLWEMRK